MLATSRSVSNRHAVRSLARAGHRPARGSPFRLHAPERLSSRRRLEPARCSAWLVATRSGYTLQSDCQVGVRESRLVVGPARGNPFRLHAPKRLSSRHLREPADCQSGSWQPIQVTRSGATVKSAPAAPGSHSARLVATCLGYTLRSDCQVGVSLGRQLPTVLSAHSSLKWSVTAPASQPARDCVGRSAGGGPS